MDSFQLPTHNTILLFGRSVNSILNMILKAARVHAQGYVSLVGVNETVPLNSVPHTPPENQGKVDTSKVQGRITQET